MWFDMAKRTYRAQYRSPGKQAGERGVFEFESEFRASTKGNLHDARMAMLERFGSKAVSWQIHGIELAEGKDNADPLDGQLELDFRDAPKKKRARRTVQRGRL